MSTKIYNGVKFKSRDWKEVLDQLISLKEVAIEMGNNSIRKRDLETFIVANKLIDKDTFDIFSHIKGSVNDDYNNYLFSIRIKFSVMLYPTKEGDIYGYYFTGINEYDKLLDPFVDEYMYYDNTDRPEELTDEEWDERGKKWDEMVPDRFSDTGFKYQIVSADDLDRRQIQDLIKEVMAYLKRDNKLEELGIK